MGSVAAFSQGTPGFDACSQVSRVSLPWLGPERSTVPVGAVVRGWGAFMCVLNRVQEPKRQPRPGDNGRKRGPGAGCRSPWPPGYCSVAHRHLRDCGGERGRGWAGVDDQEGRQGVRVWGCLSEETGKEEERDNRRNKKMKLVQQRKEHSVK